MHDCGTAEVSKIAQIFIHFIKKLDCLVLNRLVGLRVNQIYDIDNKTYLIKFQDKDVKQTLLFESGIRFHTTSFEWPKNPSPSGFTMKLRKHLKNKRLESLKQLGTDRIIDFQFGVGDATYHLILELYDRGNLILCDHEMTILNVLRPHTEGEEVRFVVREKYPEARARMNDNRSNEDIIREALSKVKSDDSLMRMLVPVLGKFQMFEISHTRHSQ